MLILISLIEVSIIKLAQIDKYFIKIITMLNVSLLSNFPPFSRNMSVDRQNQNEQRESAPVQENEQRIRGKKFYILILKIIDKNFWFL